MAMKTIRVVVAKPGERAEVVEVPNTLEAMQKIVGGLIELVPRRALKGCPAVDVYVNEEGIGLRLRPNRFGLLGPIVVGKSDAEGDEIGLTTAEAKAAVQWLDASFYLHDPDKRRDDADEEGEVLN